MRPARYSATEEEGMGFSFASLCKLMLVAIALVCALSLVMSTVRSPEYTVVTQPYAAATAEVVATPPISIIARTNSDISSGSERKSSSLCQAALLSPVRIVGSRPVGTYLCEYFPLAKRTARGCTLQCPVSIGGGGKEEAGAVLQCDIVAKGSSAELAASDIIVHHHGPIPDRGGGAHVTVFYSGESNASEGKKASPAYQSKFDIVVSFHTFRRFYFTWIHRFQSEFQAIATSPTKKKWPLWSEQLDAVAVFVSRCGKGGRDQIIYELAKRYKVHSFGKCRRTHKLEVALPKCAALGGRYPQKMCAFARYRFVLALDNTREMDYVTEKVYHGLLSGAIPIYTGAPNVDDFLPMPSSVIKLADYAKPRSNETDYDALVEHLKTVNSSSYHFAWRSADGVRRWGKKFLEHLAHPEPTCDICVETAAMKRC